MEEFDLVYFEEHNNDGECVIDTEGGRIIMLESDDTYEVIIEPKNPIIMLCTQKLFYPDTLSMFSIGQFLKYGGTKIGVWKLYDEDGEIIEETDYDEDWEVDWEKLFPLLVVNGINLKKIVGICRCVEVGEGESFQKYEAQDYVEGGLEKNDDDVESTKEIHRYWIVTELVSANLLQENAFDGYTGNKLWSEYKVIK